MSSNTAQIIQQELRQQRRSRGWLADAAGMSLSTLDKAMSGHRSFPPGALQRIAALLAVDLQTGQTAHGQVAPEELGGYARGSVRWMEGRHLAVRRAFQADGAILAYALRIAWDDEARCLVFLRSDDFGGPVVQRGRVAVSTQTGLWSLVGADAGQYDLTIFRRAEGVRMFGLCTTLFYRQGAPTPASSPIMIEPLDPEAEARPACGLVERGQAQFATYAALLDDAERDGLAKLASRNTATGA